MIANARIACGAWVAAVIVVVSARTSAHSGPPYPVVTNQAAGAYRVSIWTDPDATDDGSAAGHFWVTIEPARAGAVPHETRALVTVRPTDRDGAPVTGDAMPVDGDVTRQYVAVVMNHEGPYAVHVALDGGWGPAAIDTEVQATYDLRPPVSLIALYLLPFLLAGFLWTKRLLRRRGTRGTGVRT
jgi:hypothetical protein